MGFCFLHINLSEETIEIGKGSNMHVSIEGCSEPPVTAPLDTQGRQEVPREGRMQHSIATIETDCISSLGKDSMLGAPAQHLDPLYRTSVGHPDRGGLVKVSQSSPQPAISLHMAQQGIACQRGRKSLGNKQSTL